MVNAASASKQPLFWILLCIAAPFVFAYSAYYMGWYQEQSRINKGMLITSPFSISQVFNTERNSKPLWRILYFTDSVCDIHCSEQLELLTRVHRLLGRQQSRVQLTYLSNTLNKPPFPFRAIITTSLPNSLTSDQVYLVDPHNNVVLSYKLSQLVGQAILDAKNILWDLKKLLKYSRIG